MSVNTNISVVRDSYATDQSVMHSAYAIDKYKLSFEEIRVKSEDLPKIIKEVKEIDKNVIVNKFNLSIFYDYYVIESDDTLLTIDTLNNKERAQINYYFNSYTEAQDIFKVLVKYQDKDDDLYVTISNFFFDNQKSIKKSDDTKLKKDFKNTTSDYYPYLDTEEMFKQFMLNDSNILLLCGKPGIGKTKLGDAYMEYLLDLRAENTSDTKSQQKVIKEEIDGDVFEYTTSEYEGIKVAYVKNEEILSQDLFWNDIREEGYDLIFLDDLDYGLLPRTQEVQSAIDVDKNKFISNLLSFTDGIFEQGNKTKIIITTNRDVGDIDTAVLRKGRTFDILQLRELTKDEALNIWVENGLPEDEYHGEFNTNEVLQANLGTLIKMKLKIKEENVVIKPYIKEDGISLYNKIKNPSKMGL